MHSLFWPFNLGVGLIIKGKIIMGKEIDPNVIKALKELRDWCGKWGARFDCGTEPVAIAFNSDQDLRYLFDGFDYTTKRGDRLSWNIL
jgi:hypothetical protein